MSKAPPGTQELQLLRHIARGGPASVGQVAESFGASQNLARSTVLTMMERLRAKGYLTRRRVKGVFVYATSSRDEDLLRDAVGRFVQRALEGSVSPFAAYLAERSQVSESELLDLERALERLRSKRGGTSR
ncbi:MAG TPA: BlaI/MecI/CopY family transcriptional regulator [Candidatus Eisenbacteria bacterium]|nr:BlaI/MecI/CopY family transcriptional regulator [Candidatus Eisenbacteria bacterium]